LSKKFLGTARCRGCYRTTLIRKLKDAASTVCPSCKKKEQNLNGYCIKVGAAAKRFYKLVAQGRA
jgi:hypothetical protein